MSNISRPFSLRAFYGVLAWLGFCFTFFLPLNAQAQDAKQGVGSDWRSLALAALREDPSLSATRHALTARNRETQAQYWNFLPDVTAVVQAGNTAARDRLDGEFKRPNVDFPTTAYTTDFINVYGYSVSGRLSLLDVGVNIASVQKSHALARIAVQTHNQMISAAIKRALLAYSDLYYAEQRRHLLANRVRIHDEKLKSVNRAVQQKQRTSFDQWNAQLETQLVREDFLNAQEQLGQAAAAFERVFNRKIDPKSLVEIQLPVELIPASQDEARLLVTGHNPRFRIASTQIQVATNNRDEILTSVLPDIALVGSYSDTTNRSASSPGRDENYSVTLEARYNIGRMPEALVRMLAMSSRVSAERGLAIEEQRGIQLEFDRAWHAYDGSRRTIELLRNAVESNKQILEGQRRLSQRGAGDTISTMEVESGYSRILERELSVVQKNVRSILDLMEITNLLTIRTLRLG